MKRAFLFFMTLSLALLARADEQTQQVQQALKDQGFYYGQVDGQPGPETDAAVRRYQIRQGLEVTGKLDGQTLDSLKVGSGSQDNNAVHAVPPDAGDTQQDTVRATPPPQNIVQSDRDFLSQHPRATPAPADADDADNVPPPAQAHAPAMQVVPDDSDNDDSVAPPQPAQPSQQAPPPGYGAPTYPPQQAPPYGGDNGRTLASDYVRFFRKTPYETAPPTVQSSTIARAQMRLGREGFYHGPPDGQLSEGLSRAISIYQRDSDISKSGRLDMRTLAAMGLLPNRRVVVAPQPFYGGGPVYRGVWVH
jgi:peptidoglycan hydrolase-like protein with peptidoglycan-binding domain